MRLRRRGNRTSTQTRADRALAAAEEEQRRVDRERAQLEPQITELKHNVKENHLYGAVIRVWLEN